ncbi:hypothetical protein GRX03_02850 [Halovenus sp. WSH3]|uniref:Uncharacterized protein n=1 Tax=Halovenus carboxidivorans TaxID=2692199 RepID=A0A6B0SZY0_9EURY|nr:hypothetical protein [Halovenus carboxidivorans]MXR50547.1 hypothetical protein [Halovenus carboxidivorans]
MSTTKQQGLSLHVGSLGVLHWVGIVAALASAAIHFLLGVRFLPTGLGISFILAGFGFVGAVALVLLDIRRRVVYALGLPFTLGQIVLWYLVNFTGGSKSFPGDIGTLGAIDKIAQLALVVVLIALLWDES